MLYGIPQSVVDQFIARGATQYSYAVFDDVSFTDLIHFWDSSMREIGYSSNIFPSPLFINRQWDQDSLDVQKFFDL